jgi:quinol monooxygenase YgiN
VVVKSVSPGIVKEIINGNHCTKGELNMSHIVNKEAYCVEYFYSKPGCRDLLIEGLLRLIEPTHSEKGCLQYDLIQDQKDENLVILLVKFESPELMRQHENQPFIKAFSENEMKKYCEKFTWNDGMGIESC